MAKFLSAAERSVAFYKDPKSYQPLTVMPNGAPVITCVDPRFTRGVPSVGGRRFPVAVQTGGGETGLVVDVRCALRGLYGEEVTLGYAQDRAHGAFPNLMGAHTLGRCAFVASAGKIAQQAARRTDFTEYTVERLIRLTPGMSDKEIQMAYDEMDRLGDELGEAGTLDSVVGPVASYGNGFTYDVDGEGGALVYTTNYAPGWGVDRNNMPNDEPFIRSYHDGIAAYLEQVDKSDLSRVQKRAVGAVALVRTGATCDVLMSGHPGATLLEVYPTADGRSVRVEELQGVA